MPKHKPKTTFKPGDPIYVPVGQEHIRDSDPCTKDNCMLTRAIIAFLVANYGGKATDYKVMSMDHGVSFQLKGRRYVAVFDTKTAFRIYNYDETYRHTRSKEKARAGVRPFKTRMMVESSTAIKKGPAMTTEVKKHLRALPRKSRDVPYVAKPTGAGRRLSA